MSFQPVWYNYLVKQEDPTKKYLLSNTPPHENSLIICHQIKKDFRRYALFPSYLSFFNYTMEKIDTNKFNFYEVIPNKHQKPYFDFDIRINPNDNYEEILQDAHDSINQTINKIKELLPQIQDKNIQVYNSNGNSTTKLSYHIIVDRFCFTSNIENKQFYKRLTENLNIKYKPDSNLYSSLQSFRMYGSHKPEELEMRTKKLDPDLNRWVNPDPTDEITSYLQTYLASLITNTSYCNILPSQLDNLHEPDYTDSTLTLEEIEKATEIFKNYLPSPFPYEISNSFSNKIFYERISPSYCDFCEKQHTRQESYLSITSVNKDIYYNCKGKFMKGKLIGSLIHKNRKLTKSEPKVKSETPVFRNCQTEERFRLRNTMVKLTYNYDLDEEFFRENVENKINNFIKNPVSIKNCTVHKEVTNENLIITHIAVEFSKKVETSNVYCLTFDPIHENPKIEGVTTPGDYEWLCNDLRNKNLENEVTPDHK
jgi:hypothetical protein